MGGMRVAKHSQAILSRGIFQEFFDWALNKNIDYQGDMDVNA